MTTMKFKDVPKDFRLCTNAKCPWRKTCLRQLAMQVLPDSEEQILAVNPNLTAHPEATADGACNCPFYRENRPVTYARGFTQMEERMTVSQFRSYRAMFLSVYSRSSFYDRRNGSIPLPPTEQALIRRMLSDIGFTIDDPFDRYEEHFNWND